ncbi:MAG: DUF445 family protein [Clostridiales bacterium]|nr:DUF445 family protein [Clostridiales bacterium]MCF8023016.1 DUF445 family protein [Clostridiales bacterium]
MWLSEILTKIAAGGVTGYFTNKLAVKMLFKQYCGLGGVILKTRDEFIENTSALVERDIINSRTIENELSKDEFMQVFENMITDVLKKYLYQNTRKDLAWIEIPGMSQTISNFIEFYDHHKEVFIADLTGPVIQNVFLESILSKKQVNYLTKQLVDISVQTLEEGNYLEYLIEAVYYENHDQKIPNFISPKIFKAAADNFKYAAADFHVKLQHNYDADIDEVINKLYKELRISDVLEEVERSIGKKSFAGLLGKDNTDSIANEILDRIIKFLKSPEGKQMAARFIDDFIKLLKKIDVPVLKLLDPGIRANLEQFMSSELPGLIEQAINWIKVNKQEVEDLIEESVDDVLENETGFKSALKKVIRNTALSNFTKKFKIVNEIAEGIEQNADVKSLSENIAGEIIDYIKNNSVGDIAGQLEQKNIIKAAELVKMFDNQIKGVISSIDLTRFDDLFEKKVGDIIKIDLKDYFESNIKEVLVARLKNEFLYTSKLTKLLQKEVSNRFLEIGSAKVADLVGEAYMHDNLEKNAEYILAKLKKEQSRVEEAVVKEVNNQVHNKRLADFINEQSKSNLVKIIGDNSLSYLQCAAGDFQHRKVSHFYDYLNTKEGLAGSLSSLILELVNENLSGMIDGKIQNVVADNLYKLPDEDMQKMVEDFMGTELKPITAFGGVLGGIAGGALFFGQGMLCSLPPGVRFFTSVFTFGFVGWLTNVIAMYMIFKPYEKKEIFGVPVWPRGVVAKNKSRFSASMGDFIDEELLNPEKVDRLFKDKIYIVKEGFKNTAAANNYKAVSDTLVNNSSFITQRTFESTINFVDSNTTSLVYSLTGRLKGYSLASWDLNGVKEDLKVRSKDLLLESEQQFTNYVQGVLHSDLRCKDLLPGTVKESLNRELKNFVEKNVQLVLDYIKDDYKVRQLIGGFSGKFDEIAEYKISDLISGLQKKKIKGIVNENFVELIQSLETRKDLLDYLEEKFLKEIRPDQPIGRLFNGNLMNAVHNNTDVIIEAIFDKGIGYLQSERKQLKQMVLDGIEEHLDGNPFKQWGFNALDGDDTVRDIVDDILDYKLPSFLREKRSEIKALAARFIKQVEKRRVGDIGIDLSRSGINSVIDKVVNNRVLVDNIRTLLNSILDSVLEIRLKSLLQIVSINSIFDIYKVLGEEIYLIRDSLFTEISSHEEEVQQVLGDFLIKVFDQLILSVSINKLTQNIEQEDILKSVQKIIHMLYSSQKVDGQLDSFLDHFIKEVKYTDLEEMLDFEYMQEDLSSAVSSLLENEECKSALLDVLGNIVDVVVKDVNNIADEEVKDFVLELLVNSFISSVQDHFLDLMKAVNVKDVTERQINAMYPGEIEDLFNSFASRYFARLKMYGWMGAVVGCISESVTLLDL